MIEPRGPGSLLDEGLLLERLTADRLRRPEIGNERRTGARDFVCSSEFLALDRLLLERGKPWRQPATPLDPDTGRPSPEEPIGAKGSPCHIGRPRLARRLGDQSSSPSGSSARSPALVLITEDLA
jgi:hypothetical protein